MATTAISESRADPTASAAPVERRRPLEREERGERSDMLTRGLGWFSLALGAAELVAPEAVANLVGIRNVKNPAMIRLFGVREMAAGFGLLRSSDPTPWMWARVAGDLMDLAALGASGGGDADRDRLVASALAVVGVMVLDIYASREARPTDGAPAAGTQPLIEVRKTVTISRDPSHIYTFWRQLENLPRFMEHLESVRVLDNRRSSWKARGPSGSEYEWEAEITEDRPGELIAWRSLPSSDAFNTGVVRFLPAPRSQGTEVHVELRYDPPAGALGALIAKLFGEEPGQQVMSDLRRLKQVIETGEVMRSDASIACGPHPARPGAGEGASS